MKLTRHFAQMARNNAWSNARLLGACGRLAPEAFAAERTGFFPSLQRTLNHILIVDWYYLDALMAGGCGRETLRDEVPCPDVAELRQAQAETDRALIAFCDGLDDSDLPHIVVIERDLGRVDEETVAAVLSHLFVHQIHHRGQAHAMLSGTGVAPPQLDEFFLAADSPLRAGELRRLRLA